ncbi:hypothetical protein BCR44DRAFT_1441111 [Catenaria anguillulae PL171]|uniref:Uncharacterized protein n=1 Tax=Catenaria anguillulae PL171 TaxID=765915 RepID=A0A1Y2HC13_9FUNG|nr:hypothetical protein BCR44DRAFT_1441111 [Catenaria anguillulae PL171]
MVDTSPSNADVGAGVAGARHGGKGASTLDVAAAKTETVLNLDRFALFALMGRGRTGLILNVVRSDGGESSRRDMWKSCMGPPSWNRGSSCGVGDRVWCIQPGLVDSVKGGIRLVGAEGNVRALRKRAMWPKKKRVASSLSSTLSLPGYVQSSAVSHKLLMHLARATRKCSKFATCSLGTTYRSMNTLGNRSNWSAISVDDGSHTYPFTVRIRYHSTTTRMGANTCASHILTSVQLSARTTNGRSAQTRHHTYGAGRPSPAIGATASGQGRSC